MYLPLYLVTKTDGIPIPDNRYILDVPLHMIPKFKPALAGKKHQIVLGISENSELETMYKDLAQLTTYTHRIGILCTVIEIVEAEQFNVVTLNVEHRVYLEEFFISKENINISGQELAEELQASEEIIVGEINTLTNTILSHPTKFEPKLISALAVDKWAVYKMNVIANFSLIEPENRIQYLQEENHVIRLSLITEVLESIVTQSISEPKRIKKTKAYNTESIITKFRNLVLEPDTREHINREINKLQTLPPHATEHSMVLDYMSWILDIPWNTYAKKPCELSTLTKELDKSHYGLDNVKEHILEHMVIEHLQENSSGTIMCFIGPPGTGKTSIAREIATATGRALVPIALGGVSDEAEIRGHRRTYLGARPGRFVVGLKQAKSLDPLFLLDEIDKLSMTRGDPASALLELLDQEQNHSFIDRYMEVPIDFSKAMFICTANYKDQIPEALQDRIEFIEFNYYNKSEREPITSLYLVPRAIKKLGLEELPIHFTTEAIEYLSTIKQIRVINQKIQKALRMAAVKIIVRKEETVRIDKGFIIQLSNKKTPSQRLGFK